jgi:ABC-type Mn2+/Zn2+ transport system permease subunit
LIADFVASWSLFGTTYAVGLLAAVALAQVGLWVVARNQIFLGAAVAQASALGVATALFAAPLAAPALGGFEGSALPTLLAVAASITTAWLVGAPRGPRSESPEALNAFVYLLASSVPVLLLANSPHGLEEIQRLLFSTLLTANTLDLALFAALALAGAVLTATAGRALLLLSVDPESATAFGLRTARWRAFSAIWLGLAVGLAIRATGTLYAFGCLVLPALAAKGLCREVGTMAWVAPALGAGAALAGFFAGHVFDVPPAHAAVAILAACVALSWLAARARSPRGLGTTSSDSGKP